MEGDCAYTTFFSFGNTSLGDQFVPDAAVFKLIIDIYRSIVYNTKASEIDGRYNLARLDIPGESNSMMRE